MTEKKEMREETKNIVEGTLEDKERGNGKREE